MEVTFKMSGQKNAYGVLDYVKKRLLVENALRDVLEHATNQAQQNAPEWTGNLKRNIFQGDIDKRGFVYTGNVSVGKAAPYAQWVESGTGIYGPFHAPIVPKTAKMLVWRNRYSGNMVAARSVKGQPGQHFMRDAVVQTKTVYIPYRLALLRQQIKAAI